MWCMWSLFNKSRMQEPDAEIHQYTHHLKKTIRELCWARPAYIEYKQAVQLYNIACCFRIKDISDQNLL